MRSLFSKLAFGSLFAILLSVMTGAWAEAVDPGMGTWKLNLQKSKYNPGPALKSLTVIFEPAGKGVKATADYVTSAGDTISTQYTAYYDGKDYPITGSPNADTVVLKHLGAKKIQRTDKKGGKVVQTFVRTVAADGKTMTITQKGKNNKGEAFNNVLVLAKQ